MKTILLTALVALSSAAFAQDYLATSSRYFYLENGMEQAEITHKPTTITVEDERIIRVFWAQGIRTEFLFLNQRSDDGHFLYMDINDNSIYEIYYNSELATWFLKAGDNSYIYTFPVDHAHYLN